MPDMRDSKWRLCAGGILWFLLLSMQPALGAKPLKIVGLFDASSAHLKTIFSEAIAFINKQEKSAYLQGIQLDVDGRDSVFRKSEQLCKVLRMGVVAVVTLHEATPQDFARSVCDALEIPLVDIGWKNQLGGEARMISLHPDVDTFVLAFYDLINLWGWNSFVILYERSEDLRKYRGFFGDTARFRVTFRQLENTNYHPVLREIKISGDTKIILDCSETTLKNVLRQAQQLRLTTPAFHYLLSTWDVHALDLSSFVYDQAKITAFQLIDSNATAAFDALLASRIGRKAVTMTTEEAIIFDSIIMMSAAFRNMGVASIQPYPVNCETGDSWSQGSEVFNAISNAQITGLTGRVSFDGHGLRSDIRLNVVQVAETGLLELGYWNSTEGIKMGPPIVMGEGTMKGKMITAITVSEEPYVMLKKDHEFRVGNDRYEGYAVDLMNIAAKDLEFNYTLVMKPPGHGVYNPDTNQWDGLIGELIAKRGDVAVGGITISHNREQVIDFTKPFMHLGISILYQRPTPQPPDLFSFLHPFSADIWLYIVMALVLVSLTIFLLARFSPYEWYNPHPCDVHMDVVENQFTIGNSLWFTVGSLFQQGSDVWPRAVSTRMTAGCWWFFTLIMIASYTANLAAFLAVETIHQPIKSADDLAKQTEIKYGCYKGGATYNFFKESKHPVYQKMWQFMNLDSRNFVETGSHGPRKVIEEKYAYLMESPSLEYTVNQHCQLMQVGGLLDSKGFGFATQQNSPYRDEISKTILRLQENSQLEVLKDKWWKKNAGVCGSTKPQDANSELGLANVGGVFLILLGGIVVALVIAAGEFIYSVKKMAKITKRPFCSEVGRAFVYALKMKGSKPKTLADRGRPCLI